MVATYLIILLKFSFKSCLDPHELVRNGVKTRFRLSSYGLMTAFQTKPSVLIFYASTDAPILATPGTTYPVLLALQINALAPTEIAQQAAHA